jgi:hypothetical protein
LAATSAFDLVCNLDVMTESSGVREADNSQETLRIDTQRRQYCKNDCSELRPVLLVTARRIVLEYPGLSKGAPPGIREALIIDQQSWRYHGRLDADGAMHVTALGQCLRKPFSGFPASPSSNQP